MDERLENSKHVEQLAQKLHRGELSLDRFLSELVRPKTVDLDEVQLDLDRQRRCGYPEVVFGEGKPLPILERLLERMVGEGIDVLATRISPEVAAAACAPLCRCAVQPAGPHAANSQPTDRCTRSDTSRRYGRRHYGRHV